MSTIIIIHCSVSNSSIVGASEINSHRYFFTFFLMLDGFFVLLFHLHSVPADRLVAATRDRLNGSGTRGKAVSVIAN